MIPVVLVGSGQEVALGEQLTAALGKTRRILHISSERIYAKKTKPYDFLIAEICPEQKLHLPCGLVIYKTADDARLMPLPEDFYALAPSRPGEESATSHFLRCGTGTDDTLSLSSYLDGSASVSLQHALERPNGEVVEPCEIPVRLSAQYDRYVLLAATAVLLLYGDVCPGDMIQL